MIESQGGQFYVGIVEDRNDPLGCGRVRVRVVGQHYHDKEVLPTKDLPWAMIMQPASGGTGAAAIGPAEGTTCIVIFEDWPENQYPIVVGTLAGIPQGDPVNIDKFEDEAMYRDEITPQGRPIPRNNTEVNGNQSGPVEAPSASPAGSGGGGSGGFGSPSIGSGTTGTAPSIPTPSLSAVGGQGTGAITPGLPSITSAGGSAITGGLGQVVNQAGQVLGAGTALLGQTSTTSGVGGVIGSIINTVTQIGNALSGQPTQTSNPLAFLTNTASQPSTSKGVVQSIIEPGAMSLGAVGGMIGSVNQLGATMNIAKNQFEGLARQYGNADAAVRQFTMIASQSGPLGNALAAAMNGQASLRSIAQSFGMGGLGGIGGIQSSISGIKSATSLSGVLVNAEQLIGQVGSVLSGGASVADAVIGELSQVSAQGTIGAITKTAGDIATQVTGEIAGTVSAALNSVQSIAGTLGLGNITGGAQDALGQMKNIFSEPQAVAAVLNNEYSTGPVVAANVGNITVLQDQAPPGVATAADFKEVKEGSTPPVSGAFGGPNYGGASPVLEKPVDSLPKDKVDTSAGSQNPLNLTPPKGFDKPGVRENLKILVDACMKHGLSTKEQQAALLGIVGGECGWVPQNESCQYSDPAWMCTIFQSTFKGKPDLAQKYANWKKGNKGTPEQFFNFVYDPSNNGRQLGNTRPGDGGKFFGRGFIQLTGRANYEHYARLSGHPIDKNPDMMNDPKISAEIAVLYLMERVKGVAPTAHPGYFYAAKKSVGNNAKEIAAKKLAYYEHFYGTMAPESYGAADKQAGNTTVPGSYEAAGGSQQQADGQTNNRGFRDPHSKYPLNRQRYEPQTSRLARGVTKDTIVPVKDSQRERGVPVAMNGDPWNQPEIPFGAKYPYNTVNETESGHVIEIDDTPGYERLHTYHRSGTFEEIDATGTKVTKIIGDGYYILERNGYVVVSGDCNLTVTGNVNIFCRSDANIEVAGSAEMKVGGSFNLGVARNMNVAVEGNFSLWANGTMNLQAKGNGHIRSNDSLFISSDKEIHALSESNMLFESKAKLDVLAAEDIKLSTGKKLQTVSGEETNIFGTGDVSVKSNAQLALDGNPNLHLNSGVAKSAESAGPATKALVNGMVPPPTGSPVYPKIQKLATPSTHGEEQYMYESHAAAGGSGSGPQASQKYQQNQRQNEGKTNTFESEKASPTGGGGSVTEPANKSQILACNDFHGNYKLSKNFTLGMLFDGGFNGKHKLVAQNGLTPQQIVANLAALCENILEKYLEVLPGGIAGYGPGKQWVITSGYRMGNGHSDHGLGRATDISLLGAGGSDRKVRHHELVQKLDKLVSYDQLILEYRGATSWIHTGFRAGTFGNGTTNRKMGFTMVDDKTYNRTQFVLVT